MKAFYVLALFCIFQVAPAIEVLSELTSHENTLSEDSGAVLPLNREARSQRGKDEETKLEGHLCWYKETTKKQNNKKKGQQVDSKRKRDHGGKGRQGGKEQKEKQGYKNIQQNDKMKKKRKQQIKRIKKQGRKGGRKGNGKKNKKGKNGKIVFPECPALPAQECLSIAKVKKFARAQTELKLAKQIKGWLNKLGRKATKAAFTFNATFDAIDNATGGGLRCDGDQSILSNATETYTTLKNCSVSAAENCDQGSLDTDIDGCITSLERFTLSLKDCLFPNQTSNDAEKCTCVNDISNPDTNCFDFKTMNNKVKQQMKICNQVSRAGSFGNCREVQRSAGVIIQRCCAGTSSSSSTSSSTSTSSSASTGTMTTGAPARRMDILRRFNIKLN